MHTPKTVDKELLCDVALAVGVLKGKVEFVVLAEHVKTVTGLGTWALHCAAGAINVYLPL